jgi:hypothetical protein
MKRDGLEAEQQIREQLFDVLREFPVLYQARQGVGTKIVNPFAPLERVVRAHVNPLMLYLKDMVEEIQQGLSYLEALDRVVLFALQYKYRDRILRAVRQLSQIEGKRPYFLWGLAALLDGPTPAQRTHELKRLHRKLHLMNRYYGRRFGGSGEGVDLIPWRLTFRDQIDELTDGTYDYPRREQLNVFRNALGALDRLIAEQDLDRWYQRRLRRRIRAEMRELGSLLFDYGFKAEEICGPIREERRLANFLNDLLLEKLESSLDPGMNLRCTSQHVICLTLLDYGSVLPFRSYYRPLPAIKEGLQAAKEIERKEGVKTSRLRRLVRLYQNYQKVKAPLPSYYLSYQFSRANGDHLATREREHFGIDLTRKFVLYYYDKKKVQQKAEKDARKVYSSKASNEMLEVLHLLIQALSQPDTIRGKRLHLLGYIQSGAMGKVLIGIHKGNIVALKEPVISSDKKVSAGDQARLLDFEARIHQHVSGNAQHENIVECFGVEEEEGRRFLVIGYHPAETLGSLLRKAKALHTSPRLNRNTPFIWGDFKTVSLNLLQVLIHLEKKQVVHRDLKPSNILYLVSVEGRISLLKVIDFGVALGLSKSLPKDVHAGQIVGTLGYMAPQMVKRKPSYASDLYSVGVILYQLVSGRLPVQFEPVRDSETLKIALKQVADSPRLSLRHASPKLAAEPFFGPLTEHVDRMLARNPAHRPTAQGCYDQWLSFWRDFPDEWLQKPIHYSNCT